MLSLLTFFILDNHKNEHKTMKSRCVSRYLVVSLFLLLISIMFPVDAMKSITHIYMALAEKVDSLKLEKVTVEDVIQDLQKNDS